MYDDNEEFGDTLDDYDLEDDILEGFEISENEVEDILFFETLDDDTDNILEDDEELFQIPCSLCGVELDMRVAKFVDGEPQHISGCVYG